MIKTEEMQIKLGPQPPLHGLLGMTVTVDGERVVKAEPRIGYLHRGIEKMVESRTYDQIIPVTDRLDYVSQIANNWAYVLAVEKLASIEVPERVEYLRVIMAELSRLSSHLVWLGATAIDSGALTAFLYSFRERERVIELLEMATGARLTHNYMRIGGVSRDLPEGFVEKTGQFLDYFRPKIDEYEALFLNNYILKKRAQGVGTLSRREALNYSAAGPVLRASGVKFDLRKDRPYGVYEQFKFEVPTGKNGDCWDRFEVRMEEMRQSTFIIEQALDKLPEGLVQTPKVPRLLKPEPGEVYAAVESPRGELGVYLVSDGSIKPYRVKFRDPAFINLSLVPFIMPGHFWADLVIVLSSLDPSMGGVDR